MSPLLAKVCNLYFNDQVSFHAKSAKIFTQRPLLAQV